MPLTADYQAPEIAFGTDGWRARTGDTFTFENVRRCADAVARWVTESGTGDRGVVVGWDRRFASEHFALAAAEVLLAHNVPVFLPDQAVPTPVASLSVVQRHAAAGIVITASHNPWTDNGFKVKAATGAPADGPVIAAIEGHLADRLGHEIARRSVADGERAGLVDRFVAFEPYEKWVARTVDLEAIRAMTLGVLVEPMWGAGAGWLPRLLDGGRLRLAEIHNERNPYFGGVNPEPIRPNVDEALARCIATGQDLALMLDGDADRLGAGDERGTFIHQLQLTGLFAYYLAEHRGATDPVVITVNNTAMVARLAARYGFALHETAVGFRHVAPRMLATGAMLGAEESGGYGFAMHLPERDGIFAALLLLDLVRLEAARERTPVSRIVARLHDIAGPSFYDRVDVHVDDDGYASVRGRLVDVLLDEGTEALRHVGVSEAAPIPSGDGVKYHTAEGSWLLLRASGTESLVRVYTEAATAEQRDALLAAGERLARQVCAGTSARPGREAASTDLDIPAGNEHSGARNGHDRSTGRTA